MRSLRYNESFGSISFAGVSLDSLQGVQDSHGDEYVCTRTKRGTSIRIHEDELKGSCLLAQEVRALAATSKKLRRMDFSGCVTTAQPSAQMDSLDEEPSKRDPGCGIVEALAPLCRYQTTNVDWICLNGIVLSDTDMDYLISAAVDKSCHFRAIELNRCGLGDRSLGLVLDALRAHENTLESIQIAGNAARLDPSIFDSQLSVFGFIRKLNLSNLARTSSSEPLLTAETLLFWRLQELRLSGTLMNSASIDAVATYLAHPQSRTLHELYIDNAYLSGSDVATLLHSLTQDKAYVRDLHLDISHNILTKGLEKVTTAIAEGLTPSHLTMRAIEYREESQFRRMVNALTANKTIRSLDMSQTALPGDATDETSRALSRLLSDNNTLTELDWSGEASRLASSKFGPGINDALVGLKHNKSLITFRVEKQKLGLQGASTLAEVLKENTTLRELHCANNEIPLHGLTDLVNSLVQNTTLIYLPAMIDGREAAFRTAEMTMKGMSDPDPPVHPSAMRSATFTATSGVRRGLTSVRKSAGRVVSYTPSFPALSAARTPSPSTSLGTVSPPSFHARTRSRTNSLTTAPSPLSFTVQDIQTTHRLLTEQWDRQCYRLTKYLERNWNLMNDIPVDLEVEDEKFERPESVGSLGKVLEKVKADTTPRYERDAYFDSPQEAQPLLDAPIPDNEKLAISFKQFIIGDAPETPDSIDELNNGSKQLRLDTRSLDEPSTPTQNYFSF
jgi:Ran GTPase-activating protein (RanGAP) involved in mRNA processing and transport